MTWWSWSGPWCRVSEDESEEGRGERGREDGREGGREREWQVDEAFPAQLTHSGLSLGGWVLADPEPLASALALPLPHNAYVSVDSLGPIWTKTIQPVEVALVPGTGRVSTVRGGC